MEEKALLTDVLAFWKQHVGDYEARGVMLVIPEWSRVSRDFSKEQIYQAILSIKESDFLMGRRPDVKFEITPNWAFKYENFAKIAGGSFRNRPNQAKVTSAGPQPDSALKRQLNKYIEQCRDHWFNAKSAKCRQCYDLGVIHAYRKDDVKKIFQYTFRCADCFMGNKYEFQAWELTLSEIYDPVK